MIPASLIDLYCERTGPGFWNEPINALSNLAFLIAAYLAWRVVRRRDHQDPLENIVILLAASIGVGSFLFHTVADWRAELVDVIPIWSFVAAYVFLAIYRATDQNLIRTGRIALIAAGISAAIFWFTATDITTSIDTVPPVLNESLQYAPAVVALLIFATLMQLRRHPARTYVTAAAGTFLLSLIFRTVDLSTCAATGIGTHFIWHLLNALMVGLLLQALVRKMPPAA